MTRNTWIVFGVIVVALFGGLIYLSMQNNVDVSNIKENSVLAASKQSGDIADHVLGTKTGKVTLIEYGDYQCPGCGSAYQPIKTVTEKYKDQLTFVFRNFPLTNIHPNARAAAAAAETAGLMGKYWQMHDALYENQTSWQGASSSDREELFAGYAEQIGLDKAAFLKTLADKNVAINQKISFDQSIGKKINVTGTPTFILNGKVVSDKVKDGKLVPESTADAAEVWTDAKQFEQLILLPAFKQAGVDVSTVK